MKINNKKELNKAMKDILRDVTKRNMIDIEEIVNDFIRQWYADYKPQVYQRTYKFLNSCTSVGVDVDKDMVHAAVYIDTGVMLGTYFFYEPEYPRDIVGVKPPEEVLYHADRGEHGSDMKWRQGGDRGVRFWTDSNKEVNDKRVILNNFETYLKSLGIPYKFIGEYDGTEGVAF